MNLEKLEIPQIQSQQQIHNSFPIIQNNLNPQNLSKDNQKQINQQQSTQITTRNFFQKFINNPMNDQLYEKLGFIVFLITVILLILTYFKEIKNNNETYLVIWCLFYICSWGKFKKYLILNLMLFIWGNYEIIRSDKSQKLILMNMICILITNLEFYLMSVMVIVTILIFIAIFICYIFKINDPQAILKNKNLKKISLSIIKTHQIDKVNECTICYQNKMNCKLKCGHYFHKKCIQNWMLTNTNCPICRTQLS